MSVDVLPICTFILLLDFDSLLHLVQIRTFGLHVVNCVRRLDIERDCFACECFDENLHVVCLCLYKENCKEVVDNKGVVDPTNNLSVGGRTHHVDVRNYFLRDLNYENLLVIKHVSGEDKYADIFTKNTTGPIFEKHTPNFIIVDEYMDGDADTPEPQNM